MPKYIHCCYFVSRHVYFVFIVAFEHCSYKSIENTLNLVNKKRKVQSLSKVSNNKEQQQCISNSAHEMGIVVQK